jgi:hypothetical protein
MTPYVPEVTQTNYTSHDTTRFGSPEAVPGGRDIEIERDRDLRVAAQEDVNSRFDQSYQGQPPALAKPGRRCPT